jgi:UDP-N-acetylmuramate dehydrogenase
MEHKQDFFILGFGSNLLVRDGGLRGVVLRLRGEFESVVFPGGLQVRAGAAVRLPQLVTACAGQGLAGTEPLVGVPGTVGGALVMNAGTRDGEIGSMVREVDVFDHAQSRVVTLPAEKIHFEYRKSSLGNALVIGCLLELKEGDRVDIMERVRRYQDKRQQTQPIHTFNAGSVFKNPPGYFVAELIEAAGLKGMTKGGARVSPLHANFIENNAGATATDVLALVEFIRAKIRAERGIELETEMKVVGVASSDEERWGGSAA